MYVLDIQAVLKKIIKPKVVFINETIDRMLIFFKIVLLSFNTFIPLGFPLIEAPLKLSLWY